MSTKLHGCKQEGCTLPEGGSCLEGLEPADCPHHIWITGEEPAVLEDDETGVSEAKESEGGSEGLEREPELEGATKQAYRFHSGELLTPDEVTRITRRHPATMVFVAGEPDSGKTTLLASLHELFQKAPVAGYSFCGSLTLPGLEKLSFKARIASGRTNPDTERTQLHDGIRFVHWAVKSVEHSGDIRHLLISNISGEFFRYARASDDDAQRLRMLSLGHYVVFLVDGERLSDPRARHRAKTNALTSLESLVKLGILSSDSKVCIMFSKWDILEKARGGEKIVASFEEEARKRFADRLGELAFTELAARPISDSDRSFGYGVSDFFKTCLSSSKPQSPSEFVKFLQRGTREYCRYGLYSPPPASVLSPNWVSAEEEEG